MIKQKIEKKIWRENLADKLPAPTSTSLECFGIVVQQGVEWLLWMLILQQPRGVFMELMSLSPQSETSFLSKLWLFFEGTGLTTHNFEEDFPKRQNNYRKKDYFFLSVINVLW